MSGTIKVSEIKEAEVLIIKLLQQESFGKNDGVLNNLQIFTDANGVVRMKTKILQRKDNQDFLTPAVLPYNHALVDIIIQSKHEELLHAGVQTTLHNLREEFWIIKSRKYVRTVLSRCVKCRRFSSKSVDTVPAPLPEDRVKDAAVFEVTGVDLTGPLNLKNGEKSWIVLFTCAVYRAVHLELITSLSTEAFLEAFRRFIARRGRPSIMYSDNGTNFVGTENALKKLDWEKIKSTTLIEKIVWKFNPVTGSWWGGFFERLIGLVKQILRKILGRACLSYEELSTILCHCEYIVNSRPLTYVSEDSDDLLSLTPNMFLQDIKTGCVEDFDTLDSNSLNKRRKYRLQLREDLRKRFRKEYLSQLHNKTGNKTSKQLKVGEIVFIGSDQLKRMNWPLGKIIELFPGKDSVVRVAKIKTQNGECIRPVQRLFPLEVISEDHHKYFEVPESPAVTKDDRQGKEATKPERIVTRIGRIVKPVVKFDHMSC